jgi:hypothetical protein
MMTNVRDKILNRPRAEWIWERRTDLQKCAKIRR